MDAYTILLFLSICRAELVSRLLWILMWKGLLTSSLSNLFHRHPRLRPGIPPITCWKQNPARRPKPRAERKE